MSGTDGKSLMEKVLGVKQPEDKASVETQLENSNATDELQKGISKRCPRCKEVFKLAEFVSGNSKVGYCLKCRREVANEHSQLKRKVNIGTCPICKKNDKLVFDHCHVQLRGFICQRCNLLLGMAQDDVSILSGAISYLLTFQNKV